MLSMRINVHRFHLSQSAASTKQFSLNNNITNQPSINK